MLICMALLFSLFSLRTAEPKNEETLKTIFPVHVIHKTGDDKENFVIVIMGDGYTADEQDKFLQDAKQKAQGMLRWSPYKEYSDHINIYARMQILIFTLKSTEKQLAFQMVGMRRQKN